MAFFFSFGRSKEEKKDSDFEEEILKEEKEEKEEVEGGSEEKEEKEKEEQGSDKEKQKEEEREGKENRTENHIEEGEHNQKEFKKDQENNPQEEPSYNLRSSGEEEEGEKDKKANTKPKKWLTNSVLETHLSRSSSSRTPSSSPPNPNPIFPGRKSREGSRRSRSERGSERGSEMGSERDGGLSEVTFSDGESEMGEEVKEEEGEEDGGGRRMSPLSVENWKKQFDEDGKIINIKALRVFIFYGGCTNSIRKEVWPFLLGVFSPESTTEERNKLMEEKRKEYDVIKNQWSTLTPTQIQNHKALAELQSNIRKDVVRTDRADEFYNGEDNEHVDGLYNILMTYLYYNWDVGYEQGMNDLLSPIFKVCEGDEGLAFWCFVGLLDMLKTNFQKDEAGIHIQLEILQLLLKLIDPELHQYFEEKNCFPMIFCFRWIVVHFKREFQLNDVMMLWEIIWCRHLSPLFHLFVALAIMSFIRDQIMMEELGFAEMIEYITLLSNSISLERVLLKAETLYYEWGLLPTTLEGSKPEFKECMTLMNSLTRMFGLEEEANRMATAMTRSKNNMMDDEEPLTDSQERSEEKSEPEEGDEKEEEKKEQEKEIKRKRNTSLFDTLRNRITQG